MIERSSLPDIALSVRQPWAWGIIYGGKDCENRGPMMIRHLPLPREREIAIHASKGITQAEYRNACEFMENIGVKCPPAAQLARGGIIGKVRVTRITKPSQPPQSRWYMGPCALMLADPEPCEFIPCSGALGYFRWKEGPVDVPELRWMQPKAQLNVTPLLERADPPEIPQGKLFGDE